MASRTGKLPQWWLDNTPHDTLEEKIERKKKEDEEKKAQEEADENEANDANDVVLDDSDTASQTEITTELLDMNGTSDDDMKDTATSEKNGYRRTSNPRTVTPEEYESTDYNAERARLRHVTDSAKKKRNSALSPTNSIDSSRKSLSVGLQEIITSPQEEAVPESAPFTLVSPVSSSNASTPSSLASSRKPARHFKTAFTGVSPFDFAMQQRAREQERREKERVARESLARHHAEKVESDRATQHKQKDLEEKRKKKEAEENLKMFKKVTLDADLATELKRQQQEDKRKKREAELQHHEYKSTS